ncbi:MAG: hypothetical protein OEW99_04655 [Gammaproteobacteria bacterium]|nr:hypothetical protein [Gammaproteobacteria bacterium]
MVIPTSLAPPIPRDKLVSIQLNVSDKNSIVKLLGNPDVKRNNGSIWIYAKGQRAAMLFMVSPGGGGGTYMRSYEWLFLRFDKNNKLIDKELIDDKYGCTKSGYCLHKGWLPQKGMSEYKLFNDRTILLQPPAADNLKSIQSGYCRLYIYSTGISNWLLRDWGMSVNVNNIGPIVIDKSTFTYIDLPAGEITITLTGGQQYTIITGDSSFECGATQNKFLGLYLAIKDAPFRNNDIPDPHHLNIFEVDSDVASKEIKNRKLIVSP